MRVYVLLTGNKEIYVHKNILGILDKSSLEAQLAEVSLARDSMVKRARAWLAKILTF